MDDKFRKGLDKYLKGLEQKAFYDMFNIDEVKTIIQETAPFTEDTYEVSYFNVPLTFPRNRERFYLLRDRSHEIVFKRDGDEMSVDIDPYGIVMEASRCDLIAVHNHPDDCRMVHEVYRPSSPDMRMARLLAGEKEVSDTYPSRGYRLHNGDKLYKIRHIIVTRRFGWCEYDGRGVIREGKNKLYESL